MVILALAGPSTGSPAVEIFTGSGSRTGGPSLAIRASSAVIAEALLPSDVAFTTTLARFRLTPQALSLMRHSAIFRLQPQLQPSACITRSAAAFLGPARPFQSTP